MTAVNRPARRTGRVSARAVRLTIDVAFLVLALVWMVQDWESHATWGAVLWALAALFWVTMLGFDRNRRDDQVF